MVIDLPTITCFITVTLLLLASSISTELICAQLAGRASPGEIPGIFDLVDRFQRDLAVVHLNRQRVPVQTTGQQHTGPAQSAEEVCLGVWCVHGARRDPSRRR